MLYLNRSRKNKGQGLGIAVVVGVMALVAAAATNLKGCGNTVNIDASGMQITCGNSVSGSPTTTGAQTGGTDVAKAPGNSTDPSGTTTGTAQVTPPEQKQPGEVTTSSPDGDPAAPGADGVATAPTKEQEPQPQASAPATSAPPTEEPAPAPQLEATLPPSKIWQMNPTGDAMVQVANR